MLDQELDVPRPIACAKCRFGPLLASQAPHGGRTSRSRRRGSTGVRVAGLADGADLVSIGGDFCHRPIGDASPFTFATAYIGAIAALKEPVGEAGALAEAATSMVLTAVPRSRRR